MITYIARDASPAFAHYGVKGMRWGKHLNDQQLNQAVNDTITGNYGNGADRQKALGDNYKQIQDAVNKRLGVNVKNGKKSSKSQKRLQRLANDAIQGRYGNGADREKALGSNYQAVQNAVNVQLLGKKVAASIAKAREWDITFKESSSSKKTDKGKKAVNKVSKKTTDKDAKHDDFGTSPYFEHHGIKGQKWGVRRYQDKNGKLTGAGKKRYGSRPFEKTKTNAPSTDGKANPKKATQLINVINQGSKSFRNVGTTIDDVLTKRDQIEFNRKFNDDVAKLSDQELKKRYNRINLENNYYNAIAQKQTYKGEVTVGDVMHVVGNVAATAGSVATVALAIKQLRG